MAATGTPKAIIFDMDGTLVDNIPYHKEAWMVFLKKYGIVLSPEAFQAQNHGTIDEMIRRFFGVDLPVEEVERLGQEKESTYRLLYQSHIREVAGLTSLLERMRMLGIRASLATMGDTPNIDFVLDGLSIRPFFDSVTGGHEVVKGKPDAEIFFLALKKMGLHGVDCLVVEDSIGGVVSAKRAGIRVVGVATSHTPEELRVAGCFRTITDFNELKSELDAGCLCLG
jgi:beta-phosphoglucomutase